MTAATPAEGTAGQVPRCWCGNGALAPFSEDYLRCERCETLVTRRPPGLPEVRDEQADLYGLNYFVEHARALGHPDLFTRTSSDLPERCAHWLRTLLRHRPPPARTLELGCASGAFVGLLAEAGYDAAGLDLSPALTRYAAGAFGVPVLTGPLEAHRLPAGSVDVLVMMDVLEHLPDPLATLAEAGRVLAADGLLLVQTPDLPAGVPHAELVARRDPFLQQLKPEEHLFLLSRGAARALLSRAGFGHVAVEPAIFAHYDQFLVASRQALAPPPDARQALRRTRGGRVVEALLDACAERDGLTAARDQAAALAPQLEEARGEVARLQRALAESERDRAARLDFIHQQERRLEEVERDRAARLEVIHEQERRLEAVERDRAAHLEVTRQQERRIEGIERDRAARLDFIHQQERRIEEIERDRAARLDVIHQQERRIEEVERDRAARLDVIHQQERRIEEIERDRAERLEDIRRLEAQRDALGSERAGLLEEQARLGAIELDHQALLRRLGPLRRLFQRRRREGQR